MLPIIPPNFFGISFGLAGLAVVAVAGAILAPGRAKPKPATAAASNAVPVVATTAGQRDVPVYYDALGTVMAVQFAQHFPQRRMLLVYAVALVIGSVLVAAATGSVMFIVGHILQGLCTSLLLIAAVWVNPNVAYSKRYPPAAFGAACPLRR